MRNDRYKRSPLTLGHAAAFIDYENLYYYVRNRINHDYHAEDYILELAAAIGPLMKETCGSDLTVRNAYADFGAITKDGLHIQKMLYLGGTEPRYVPGTLHRNAVNMQLCIDAVELMHSRQDVMTFAIIAADRDYLPLIQQLKRFGKSVFVVAFRPLLSAELLRNIGDDGFIDASTLLPDDMRRVLVEQLPDSPDRRTDDHATFNQVRDIENEITLDALFIIEDHFGQYEEIYLTPLLRKLSEELEDPENQDPKTLINDLELSGAICLEKRRGEPYDYTVLILNDEHPQVISTRERVLSHAEFLPRNLNLDGQDGQEGDRIFDLGEDGEEYDRWSNYRDGSQNNL